MITYVKLIYHGTGMYDIFPDPYNNLTISGPTTFSLDAVEPRHNSHLGDCGKWLMKRGGHCGGAYFFVKRLLIVANRKIELYHYSYSN